MTWQVQPSLWIICSSPLSDVVWDLAKTGLNGKSLVGL